MTVRSSPEMGVMWQGTLPGPIAYWIFCDRMREKYGDFSLREVLRYMVMSALARGDERSAEIYVRDALGVKEKVPAQVTPVQISKFSPGEHFYVFREKFSSYQEARRHAESKGYLVLPGLKIESMNDLILAARAARKED